MADRDKLNEDLLARLNSVHKLTQTTEEIASLQQQGLIGLNVDKDNPTPVAEFLAKIDAEVHAAQEDIKNLYK